MPTSSREDFVNGLLGVVAVEVRIGDLDQPGAAEAWLVAAVGNADGALAEALHGLPLWSLGHGWSPYA